MSWERTRPKGARARKRAGRSRAPGAFLDRDDERLMYSDERDNVREVELTLVPERCHGEDCSFYEIRFLHPTLSGWWEVDPGIAAAFGKGEVLRRVRAMFPTASVSWVDDPDISRRAEREVLAERGFLRGR